MFFDFLADFFRTLFIIAATLFLLAALPFVIAHAVDTWDAPLYPHSGFCPDCPQHVEPADADFIP